MRLTPLLATSVVFALAALGACSGEDDPTAEELQEDIAEELRDVDADLTQEQADCFAGVIVDELGADAVNDIDFAAAEPEADEAEALASAAIEARDTCDLGDGATGAG
ncbi:MAG: hypothetical protein Q8K58_11260 [Acidimicrobiales bacterium]|nr:hypothetical protein [Acidimicrobiales bacterium]